MRILIAISLFLPFAFCLLPSPAGAHTFHTSLTRMDYNAEGKTVEITIQVFAHDLETAIEKRAGKRVNLEKSPDSKKLILDYLNNRFALKNKTGETKQLSWVGKEQSADSVWIYVEAKSPEGVENATLENRLFFELHNDQVNLVTCRFSGKKQDFAFKPGDGAKKIISPGE
ncbi:MAG: hypothetical protein M3209_12750 [Acidobacteriota bacterium]|nr:hypothetical protein [Acidobacteriota bacterium]